MYGSVSKGATLSLGVLSLVDDHTSCSEQNYINMDQG